MAILKPPPSSPRSASSGTSQSSKATLVVGLPRWPIFSSGLPGMRPLVPPGTRKALTPLGPASPVRAQTT